MGIPVALLLAVGAIMWTQLSRMRELSQWVDHTDQVIARVYEAQRDIAVQEAAFRGFLLSGDRTLLDRFAHARTTAIFAEIRQLVGDNPPQQARLDEVALRHESWLQNIAPALVDGADIGPFRTKNAFDTRRRLLEGGQAVLVKMTDVEQELRRQRVLESAAANDLGIRIALGLFVVLALAIAFFTRKQLTAVAETYTASLASERATRRASEDQNWIRTALMQLSVRVQGELTIEQLGQQALAQLAESANAVVAAFYVGEPGGFKRCAGHGLADDAPEFFAPGEGLVGRAAAQTAPLHVRDAPAKFLKVQGGVGESRVSEVILVPAKLDGVTAAVLEFGFFGHTDGRVRELFERIGETIATAVRSTSYRQRLRELLEESRRQTEELQTQQEELRVTNEELHAQTDALRSAHAQLEERKEELETSNAHLVSQRDALERMQRQLADKAIEVERASRYKSEFLANMSHELRTPLNSTLILAKVLADNKTENLTAEQIKFANTIYASGSDLLALINDILDLSKIESGKVDVHAVTITLDRLVEPVVQTFEPVAKQQSLEFVVSLDSDVRLLTDEQRVRQILKNLLSNAFKFTAQGKVELSAQSDGDFVDFIVTDSGIGIPKNQHEVIFEAFRQADGTTNRRFGGTGLGLSISRDLARLLGGELRVESQPGQGSSFILRLPNQYAGAGRLPENAAAPMATRAPRSLRRLGSPDSQPPAALPAPLAKAEPGKRSLLVVEDDVAFTEVLEHLARELDFQCYVAHTADDGVRMALELIPSAVILDMQLPDHSGLSVLDRLKREPRTRHIPVHVCSVADFSQAALSMGAVGYLFKPVKYEELTSALESLKDRFQGVRRLLVVEDDAVQRDAITQLLRSQTVELVAVSTVADALAELEKRTFDCVVTDLTLPDASGYDLLEQMAGNENCPFPPVIVYTARSLTTEEEQRLRQHSSSIIIKGARSPERLLDEVTLFLHQIEADLPADRQRMLRQARDREAAFAGRKILLAEDDVRNVFALGHILEPKGAELVIARNGREALEMLERKPDIDLVLMDVMMPEMDGIQAIRAIRESGGRNARLPIIALTAKAMPDDQERCLKAGANDYMAKPLDVEMLLSLIRVWMPKN